MPATITYTTDGLEINVKYDASWLAAMKQIVPPTGRRWRKPVWVITPEHAKAIIDMTRHFFPNVKVVEPKTLGDDDAPGGGLVLVEKRKARVEYIGACKQRDGGVSTAFGWTGGDWNIIFPENVLRVFFNDAPVVDKTQPPPSGTLYAILGVKQDATIDALRSAYRRAARQWHPDVNKEPDAAATFRRLTEAYQTLAEPTQRKRYDAGLALEQNSRSPFPSGDSFWSSMVDIIADRSMPYRARYTCGNIWFKGKRSLGRWIVESIDRWDDIVDEQGRVMVSSWPKGADTFETQWKDPAIDFEVEL